MPHPKFLEGLKREFVESDEFKSLIACARDDPWQCSEFTLQDNLLLYKGRIWINRDNTFIPLLLEEFHKSPLEGHMGLAKTLSRLKQSFYWEGMCCDTQQFIRQCIDCLQMKYVPQKPAGLLLPIPLSSQPWEDLALDFITGLPNFQGTTVIMTVVDHFSKGAHFWITPFPFHGPHSSTAFHRYGVQAPRFSLESNLQPRSHFHK